MSLGADCQPAYQIGRAFGTGTLLALDWITTPLHSLMPLIDARFQDVFAEETLTWEWLEGESAWLVTDRRYGVDSKHHFKSRAPEDVAKAISMLRRAGAAFMDIIDDPGPTVFVRRWHTVDKGTSPQGVREALVPLLNRVPSAALLCLDQNYTGEPACEGRTVTCHNPLTIAWEGDNATYDRGFALAGRIAARLPHH